MTPITNIHSIKLLDSETRILVFCLCSTRVNVEKRFLKSISNFTAASNYCYGQ